MKKRRFAWSVLLLMLLLGGMLVVPASRWRLIGWVKNEQFYEGRPTSYWSAELRPWHCSPPFCGVPESWNRSPSSWEVWLGRFFWVPHAETPVLLAGDPSAVPVLTEMLQDPDWHIRSVAAECLWKLGPEARSSFAALLQAVEPVADLLHDELPKQDLFLGVFEDDRTEFCRFASAAMYRIDAEAAERAGVPKLPFGRPFMDW